MGFWSWLDIPLAVGVLASARGVPLWLDKKKAVAVSTPSSTATADLCRIGLKRAGLAELDERLVEPCWLADERDLRDWVAEQLTPCPQCGLPAEIRERFCLQSTDGPVDHVVVSCINDHHFRMAADQLVAEPVAQSCGRTPHVPSTW
jgi:hypothetical protein